MAIRSVIDIDVNDKNFQAFQQKFQQYQQLLKRQPAIWGTVSTEIGRTRKEFENLVAVEVAAIGKAKLMLEVQKAATALTREQATYWDRMGRAAKGVAGDISNMAVALTRSSTVIGAITGLLGVGGLWGINRLAGTVSAGRQNAQGLDISYGGLKAFGTNFGRYVDAKGFLGGIGQARHSAEGVASLYGIGVTDLSGDTEDVAERALVRLRQIAKTTNPQFYQNIIEATGAGNLGISYQDLNRLRGASDAEFEAQRNAQRRDRSTLNIGGQDQLAWQNLESALTRSADTLEKVIVRGLAPLTPGIEKISGGIATAVDKLFGNGDRSRMDDINKGLEEFAKYLGSEDFQKNLATFAKGVGVIADKVASVIKWFGGDEGVDPKATAASTLDVSPVKGDPIARASAASIAWLKGQANSLYGPNVKDGAGTMTPEMRALAVRMQGITGVGVVTAANDDYHKGFKSAHNEDRALDFRIDDIKRASEIIASMKRSLDESGYKGRYKIIDETRGGGPNWTGPHVHVQIDNNTGGSAVVQTQQVAQ